MKKLGVHAVGFEREHAEILKGVSFDCAPGEVIGILGPNGAGKSTLLRLIAGIRPPTAGRITFGDMPIEALGAAERAKAIAYLPQQRIIYWPIPVEAVVGLGRIPHRPFWRQSSQADLQAVEQAMAQADVLHLRQRLATQLSGGEQSGVLLARMLAQQAEVLLADEPTSALDPAHQLRIMELFRSRSRQGNLVLTALHDVNLAAKWCDRLIMLKQGQVIAEGAPADILSEELMRSAYNVECRIFNAGDAPVIIPTAIARTGRGGRHE